MGITQKALTCRSRRALFIFRTRTPVCRCFLKFNTLVGPNFAPVCAFCFLREGEKWGLVLGKWAMLGVPMAGTSLQTNVESEQGVRNLKTDMAVGQK